MNCFVIYQMMFMILDKLNEENQKENLILYLTDGNPFMRDGEKSVDEEVYDDFKKKFIYESNSSDYYYDYICKYLKELDPYYGDILSIFNEIIRDEYVDTCNDIILNHSNYFKQI